MAKYVVLRTEGDEKLGRPVEAGWQESPDWNTEQSGRWQVVRSMW